MFLLYYNDQNGRLDGYLLRKDTDTFLGESVKFSYDDGKTSARYEYDGLGRSLKVETNYATFSASHSYTYYKNGLKKSYTGPDGRTHNYSYTPINTLQGLKIDGVGNISYGDYKWLRPGTRTLPGLEQKDTYDNFLRLTGRTTQARDTKILNLSYQYNISNNIISRTSENSTTDYSYDELERLIGVKKENEPDQTYKFDPVGNRLATTSEQYTYDANNQLLAVGDTSYAYDKDGNTIQKTTGTRTTSFTYNFENRLETIKKDGLEASYYYDPFGRRLSKKVNGKTTWFAYSDEGLIAEFDETGGIKATYTWKPGSTWSTDPIMLTRSGKDYFYHNDHLGAPNSLTDSKGKLVWQASYDVYGDVKITTEEVSNNLRFPGQYFDEESGLYYNFHRYYDPKIGRYLNVDPIGLLGGINMFAYVEGNPVNGIDPLGLFSGLSPDEKVVYENGKYVVVKRVRNGVISHYIIDKMATIGRGLSRANIYLTALSFIFAIDNMADSSETMIWDENGCLNPAFQLHHWWPKELGGADKEGALVLVQSANPNLHTAEGGIHPEMRKFLRTRFGTRTWEAAKGVWETLDFETQNDLLQEFYRSHGMEMPEMYEPGLTR